MDSQLPVRRGYAPVENGELYFESVGEGPAVLLLHAAVANSMMWDPQIAPLARDHRVIRYDLRGFGRSRTRDTGFSERQDIADLLRHLEVGRAVLIGSSRGGSIALDFALENPDAVVGLVWVCGVVDGLPQQGPKSEVDWFKRVAALKKSEDWEALADLKTHTWANGIGQPAQRAPLELRRKLRAMIVANRSRVDGKAVARPLRPSAAERVSELTCPLLIVVGDLDTSGCLSAAEFLARTVPKAEQLVFHNVAHMPSMEEPERFNVAVREFFARHRL